MVIREGMGLFFSLMLDNTSNAGPSHFQSDDFYVATTDSARRRSPL
jgi:hypothetical protein